MFIIIWLLEINNNVLLQWFKSAEKAVSRNVFQTITFPLAFTTCFSVLCTIGKASSNWANIQMRCYSNRTTTTIDGWVIAASDITSTSPAQFELLAIGY